MDFLQAILLGIIQGLAEFLPISSSGHLVIFQKLFGLDKPEIFFDVCLHMGTLVAVVVFFRKELCAIISSSLKLSWMIVSGNAPVSDFYKDANGRMAIFILVGSVPTAIAGLLINEVAERLFSSIFITAAMLALTGCILWLTRKVDAPEQTTEKNPDALPMENALPSKKP